MVKKTILTDTPSNLIKRYIKLLEEKHIPIEKVILFGSYARGKPKPWSDLDICLVSNKFGKNSYDEMVLLKQFSADIDPMIEPHPYNPHDLEDDFDSLAYEIRKTGKTITV